MKQLLGKPKSEKVEQLGWDAGTFQGMYVKTLAYDGMEMTMYSPKGDRFYVVNMRVTGPAYPTSLGNRVGDPASRVLKKFATIAKDGREPPDSFAYAVNDYMYIDLYFVIKEGIVSERYYEYLID
ncbi:hypothetical protein KP806_01500 [Paenibacillus sp. N4]|uniref:hypothetical protein n=1 Tax=Paenibacillus vietnamensis TaxID=2590547 RepID=UPI001CD15371|nr:hypothetical protein [Paenibacillus vietnamensis]MCA0753709.1 hypothetical protein [Paenibacillus vietnamensis]